MTTVSSHSLKDQRGAAKRRLPLFFTAILLLSHGCTTMEDPYPESAFCSPNKMVPEPIRIETKKMESTAKFTEGNNPDLEKAYQEFLTTGNTPTLEREDFIIYPYGSNLQPIINATPLRISDIEFQEGERIQGVALGDTSRWKWTEIYSDGSSPQKNIPHLLIKPTRPGNLATNMIVITDRRTYYFSLISKDDHYVKGVRFYYPEDLSENYTKDLNKKEREVLTSQNLIANFPEWKNLEQLNFDYTIRGSKVPWRPIRVFDDTIHTYIQFPPIVRSMDMPALFVYKEGNEMELINYRVKDLYFVIDGIFKEGVLVSDIGKKQTRVFLINNSL